jgi:hypothetical protein
MGHQSMPSPQICLIISCTPYGEFLAELEEIQRLKWIASENAGHDIGFEFALNDWAQNHRASWRRMRNQAAEDNPADAEVEPC